MGDAHAGDDDIAFYAAALGRTRKIAVSTTAAQLPDTEAPLEPGRYLLHVRFDSGCDQIWVAMGEHKKGVPLPVAADVPYFPFLVGTVVALEVNVRPKPQSPKVAPSAKSVDKPNTQIAAITNAGTGTLYITQISRGA